MKYKVRILIAFMLLITGCDKQQEPTLKLVEELIEVEYCSIFDPMTLVVWGDFDEVTFDEVNLCSSGAQEIIFTAIKGELKKEFSKQILVVDSNYPFFSKKTEEITIYESTELDLNEFFTATDRNGNQTKALVTIVVKAKAIATPKPQVTSRHTQYETEDPNTNNVQQTNPPNTEAKISGVSDIQIQVNSSVQDLQRALSNVSLNVAGSIAIDYADVNLGVPGSYIVHYSSSVGATASCTVTVQ